MRKGQKAFREGVIVGVFRIHKKVGGKRGSEAGVALLNRQIRRISSQRQRRKTMADWSDEGV